MKRNLFEHYNKKYENDSCEDVKKIEVIGQPKNRFEAAVFWGGEGESLLEVGSGSGNVLLSLSDMYKRCVGIELSSNRAEELKKLFQHKDNVEILTGDVEEMDLRSLEGSFDTVMMIALLEHLIDPFAISEKMFRLLKPGGKFIIDTPNIAKWTRRIKLLFGFFPGTSSLDEGFLCYDKKTPTGLYDDGHLHYFTHRSLKKMLLKYGFSDVVIQGYGNTALSKIYPKMFSECFVVAVK